MNTAGSNVGTNLQDHERINKMLEINSHLLRRCAELHQIKKMYASDTEVQSKMAIMLTRYMRRIKDNLAFLASLASGRQAQTPLPPLTCPEGMPYLEPHYEMLRQMFQKPQFNTPSYPAQNAESKPQSSPFGHLNAKNSEASFPNKSFDNGMNPSGQRASPAVGNTLRAQQDIISPYSSYTSNQFATMNPMMVGNSTGMGPPVSTATTTPDTIQSNRAPQNLYSQDVYSNIQQKLPETGQQQVPMFNQFQQNIYPK
ncbi:SWI/SNF complex subunit Snf30 [Schizosaccharomyces cryophilus OY26]|uniref:SWI/SNF complex subunit Snf30 n=1 Tax=Schizosaccharomyces cryophilus (strain OY26 / ATCC MYA-4695 / CBS 11777 / NBRC 106824 / NRRL Y48691) TaxID=653667 RepID=S9VS01_SCHCR|nr:SWI/SNF complex subunit Snf30 [Schizosaccharomyces cryophilus OY26]EPY50718.1 SWI/SNF complex subunit Snf30 [Schizosaccharomyces cryophilus OY26]